MKKVAFVNTEYIANMPPHRFAPGDVVELDDDHADHLVRLGIAKPAKAGAKTALELVIEARDKRIAEQQALAVSPTMPAEEEEGESEEPSAEDEHARPRGKR